MSAAFDPITAIDDALDGSITPDTHAALDTWLTASPENAQLFTERARLHRNLHATMGHVAGVQPVEVPEPAEQIYPIYLKGHEPKPQTLHPRHYAVAGIAAALLAACGVAVYLLAFNAPTDPQPDPINPNQPGPSVATLIEVSEGGTLRTPHGFPAEGDDYGRGEYTLSTGTAEFMLTNAVNVKLRGETRMHMRNNMNVVLSRGSAEFVCPKDAKGFTVHLPDGVRVVDLGTRFGVTLNDSDGSTRIAVLEGEVAIEDADSSVRLPLVAPQVVRIANGRIQRVMHIDLADVVGGGDGSGSGSDAGIRLADGKIVSTHREDTVAGIAANRFVPVDHPYIDGVFVPDGNDGITAVEVSTTGVSATNIPDTDGTSWDEIWNGHNVGVATTLPAFDSVIGIHCNKGITFDLDAVRADNAGLIVERFDMTAAVGTKALGGSIIVLIDGSERARHTFSDDDTARPVSIDLRPTDRFLTVVATQGERHGDWLFLGDPTLRVAGPIHETTTGSAPELVAPRGQLPNESERTPR